MLYDPPAEWVDGAPWQTELEIQGALLARIRGAQKNEKQSDKQALAAKDAALEKSEAKVKKLAGIIEQMREALKAQDSLGGGVRSIDSLLHKDDDVYDAHCCCVPRHSGAGALQQQHRSPCPSDAYSAVPTPDLDNSHADTGRHRRRGALFFFTGVGSATTPITSAATTWGTSRGESPTSTFRRRQSRP
jgi:hypothetical protein